MQVMHDDDNNITICTALYQSSGFFIIMSPAEGLHFSALVYLVHSTLPHIVRCTINILTSTCGLFLRKLFENC